MNNHNIRKACRELVTIPRRWFPLWVLDWYILREFLIKYCILMLVFIILFVLGDVYDTIEDFFEAGASFRDIAMYLLLKLPGNIRFILPISMLLGCMWCMATFGKNLEITAMRASGVSLFRCGMPVFAAGIAVTAVNIYFNEFLVPRTENMAEHLYMVAAERRSKVQHLLAYRSQDGKRHWLFKTFVRGVEQNNVTLKTYWNKELIDQFLGRPGNAEYRKKMERVLPNKAAAIRALDRIGQEEAVFKALNGRKIDIFAKKVDFDSDSGAWTFMDGFFVSFDRKDEHDTSASRGTSAVHQQENYKKVVFSARIIPEHPEDITNAVKEKDDLSTAVILDLVRRNPNMPERVKKIYMTLFFYRISFPWACLIAVFLGIPLATRNERTGSLMAVISAVIIIVVYIVIAQVFMILGKAGMVPPVIAGTLPTLGFIAYGIWRVFFDRH
ncbi:MAG: LptF/LptG family permease [Lentisphaeria bacterium]|nr:LptF/LptG family permease [Lentisphaeria bacterium]